MMSKNKKKSLNKKYNILFIATYQNNFVVNHANFNRMYNHLIYFKNHEDFNVIVLQPKKDLDIEKISLKKDFKIYYFREIHVLGYNLVPFIDFNPFFILKVLKIVKKQRIDLIHVDFVYGINSLRLIRKIPVSYNAYNVECIYANQVGKYYHKIPKTFRSLYSKYIYYLERFALKYVKNINAISRIDKKKFIEIYETSKEKIIVSPYGYRKEIHNNPITQENAKKRLKIDKDKFIVIFHGSYYTNYANKEAVYIIKNKIAPQIKDKDLLFLIAGKIPSFKNEDNLKFLGFVNDLKNFIYSADVAIAPILRGSGVRTKIIDYLSAFIPVITTRKGAEGLLLKNGVHGYIVDNPVEDTIEKILELKNNPNKIKEFKNNINELVVKHYEWENILGKVARRYKSIIKSIKP